MTPTPSAEDIVRSLAAVEDPTVEDRDYAPSSGCGLCGQYDEGEYEHQLDDPTRHAAGCPWRDAKAWVAEHPS